MVEASPSPFRNTFTSCGWWVWGDTGELISSIPQFDIKGIAIREPHVNPEAEAIAAEFAAPFGIEDAPRMRRAPPTDPAI